MYYLLLLLFLVGCMASKPSNAIEELGEAVIKIKEGIDIRLMPVEEEKKDKR